MKQIKKQDKNECRFYHPLGFALAVAMVCLCPILSMAADIDVPAEVLHLPPRSISDITRMLDHYKPEPELAAKTLAAANAEPPATDDRKILFEFYRNRAEAAAAVGRVTQQIEDWEKAKNYGQVGTGAYARAIRMLAMAHVQGGNLLTGEKLLQEALKSIPTNQMGQFTGAYANAVSISLAVGDLVAAKDYLRQLDSTITFLRSKPSAMTFGHGWQANFERARGDVLMQEGKPAEAEAAYRNSVRENDIYIQQNPDIIATGVDTPTMENLYRNRESFHRNVANGLLAQGKVVQAEATVRRVLQMTLERTGRNSTDVAQGLRLLSLIIAEQGRYAEAALLSKAAVETFMQSGAAANSIQLANARRAYGAALVAQRKYPAAIEVFQEMQAGLKIDPVLVEKVGGGDLDWVLASLRSGQAKSAEQMAGKMLERTRQRLGEKSSRTAEVRAFHAMTLAALGEHHAAFQAFKQAVPVLVDQARNDSEAEAGTVRRQQRLVTILESYLRLLAEMHHRKLPTEGVDPINESFVLADLARGSSVQRALTSSAARAAISDPALAELARNEQDAQRRMNSLNEILTQMLSARPEQQLPAIQAKMRSDIDELKAGRDKLRAEIQKRFPEYAQLVDPKPVGMAKVQKMLRPGEVLLSWYFGEEGGQVWAVSHEGKHQFAQVDLTREQMAAGVAKLRKSLNPDVSTIDAIPPFDLPVSFGLYQKLMLPVEAAWDKATTLLVVPHAELGQLPLSVLTTAST
ncbi:MAG: hypothetical protein RIR18_2002, partial [Pseudomonadota bacterium]